MLGDASGAQLSAPCHCSAGQLFADPQAMTAAGLATLMPGAKLDAHALTQPLLLGATTHARSGKNGAAAAAAGAGFGGLTVIDPADAPAACGGYGGYTTKAGRGTGAAAGGAKAPDAPKRGARSGGAGKGNSNVTKARQLPPLQSSAPAPQVRN